MLVCYFQETDFSLWQWQGDWARGARQFYTTVYTLSAYQSWHNPGTVWWSFLQVSEEWSTALTNHVQRGGENMEKEEKIQHKS